MLMMNMGPFLLNIKLFRHLGVLRIEHQIKFGVSIKNSKWLDMLSVSPISVCQLEILFKAKIEQTSRLLDWNIRALFHVKGFKYWMCL